MGILFLLVTLPTLLLLSPSKAAFLYVPISFVVFYDHRALTLSKSLAAILVACILATPLAVAMYGSSTRTLEEVREAREIGSWDMAIEHISHREYAFEAFACVYQWRREGEPYHLGAMLRRDLLNLVPAVFWPDKPESAGRFDFPEQYLPDDYHARLTHYARHLLTPFFLDFGIVGCCLATLLVGLLWGTCYRVALTASLKRGRVWPLLMYLPLVVHSKAFVEAGICGGTSLAIGMTAVVALVVWLPSDVLRPLFRPGIRRASA